MTEKPESVTLGSILYYSKQENWETSNYYSLWRYLNRLFQERNEESIEELSSMKPERMTHNTQYLMMHMLININQLDNFIEKYPNLAELRNVKKIPKILRLSLTPSGINTYFSKNGIFL